MRFRLGNNVILFNIIINKSTKDDIKNQLGMLLLISLYVRDCLRLALMHVYRPSPVTDLGFAA